MATILAVDDKEDNLFLFKMILEGHGHEVVCAANDHATLDLVGNRSVDLALVDLTMPKMSGMELASHLKGLESTRHVSVILLTSKKKEVSDVVEALDLGADEYITKPFHETELVARVKSMLRMKTLYDKVPHANKVMAEDLRTAQRVQDSLLPTEFPYPDRMHVSSYYEATQALGGDYYDVIDYGSGRFCAIMTDVSGHGASAALVVSIIKTVIVSHLNPDLTPSELAGLINLRLLSLTPEDSYCSMFLSTIDLNENIFTYIKAGHPYPFILRQNGDLDRLEALGDLLGLFEEVDLTEETVEFNDSDRLFAYSDGLIESRNEHNEMFGMGRLSKELLNNRDLPGDDPINLLIKNQRDLATIRS